MLDRLTILQMWKKKNRDTIERLYGGHIDINKVDALLDSYIAKADKPVARMRDLYRHKVYVVDLNEVPVWLYDNHLTIGANGAYTVSAFEQLGDTSIKVMDDLDGRQVEKDLAKSYEAQNMLKEATLHDNLQLKRKQDTNSMYGIACMPGSFLFSPDSASMITTQCRQLISEMMWSFEKFLANNLRLESFDEAFAYINNILREERHYEQFKDWISFKPSKINIFNYLKSKFADIKDFDSVIRHTKTLKYFIETMSEEDRVYLYYKDNLPALIRHNPKLHAVLTNILNQTDDFLNPNKIPECYKEYCDTLISVAQEFCYSKSMTAHRVDKYFDSPRDTILLSDTDSVFIILSKLMNLIYEVTGMTAAKNDKNDFKLVNTICTICTHYIRMRHDLLVSACNTIYKFPKYNLNAKNEFYYKRVIVYAGIKKNYSGLKILREGNILPPAKQISHTGIKLLGSRIPKEVSDFQTNLIENDILRAKEISPVRIIVDIKKEREKLKQLILAGDKSLGIPQRFSGYSKYKNPESTQICILVELWNRIYPDQMISNGEYMMTFVTKIKTVDDVYKYIQDKEMAKRVAEAVYSDTWNHEANYLKAKGLSAVAIPRDGAMFTIPQWIIDIIDIDEMVRKHMTTITDLLPSLNMNKIFSKGTYVHSNLLSLSSSIL